MGGKKTDESKLLAIFQYGELGKAEVLLGIAREIVKQRQAAENGVAPKKRASRKPKPGRQGWTEPPLVEPEEEEVAL